MFNKDKIKELEKDIEFHKKYAGIRQDKLLAVRRDVEQLRADKAILTAELVEARGEIKFLLSVPVPKYNYFEWTKGEPSKIGWYFVSHKTGTTALFYNPAARCKWMRGEKGNAERFEQEVIAYMEAPDYEKG